MFIVIEHIENAQIAGLKERFIYEFDTFLDACQFVAENYTREEIRNHKVEVKHYANEK